MAIRRWEEKDNVNILAMEEQCFHDPWNARMLNTLFSDSHNNFVFEENGEILAYMSVFVGLFDWEILRIAVKAPARRRHIGKQLLAFAIDLARSSGAERFLLEVRNDNAPAKALYTSLGFTVDGVRRGYYSDGEDAVLMSLALSEAL